MEATVAYGVSYSEWDGERGRLWRTAAPVADGTACGGGRGGRRPPQRTAAPGSAVRCIAVEGPIWGATIYYVQRKDNNGYPLLGEGPTNRVPLLEEKMCYLRLPITLHVLHLNIILYVGQHIAR